MGIISFLEKRKNKEKFNNIYEEYYDTIFRRISYLTGDEHVAEDLTQEVFIKLYNNPPSHENVIAWLNKVAANISYNYLRDRKNHDRKNEVIYEGEADNVVSIEEVAISNLEKELVKKVLDMMSLRDRMCLLLKFSGYKYSEIAEVVGVDKNSVGTIISRAQGKFKEYYLKMEKWGE